MRMTSQIDLRKIKHVKEKFDPGQIKQETKAKFDLRKLKQEKGANQIWES